MILRPETQGFTVFMMQRNRRTGFMPTAWVFPGGRVDACDGASQEWLTDGATGADRMGLPLEDARAFGVAAVRETFEESGIWLGEGTLGAEHRERLLGDKEELSAVVEPDTCVDLDGLVPWSWWVTPEIEPRRYDTRFFVAVVPGNTLGVHDAREALDSRWVRPAEALAAAEDGRLPLAPPTWWTLKELAEFSCVDEVLKAAASRVQRPIQPILSMDSGEGWTLKLPGHPEHSEPAIPGLPLAVGFSQGRWWARD